MQLLVVLIAMSAALALGGCASEEKEWMKLDQKFTVAEFRRDYTSCSRNGKLDESCMRGKGWVAVSPGTPLEKAVEPARPGPPTGITTR
jgi:hypothetical protein